MDLSIIIVNWNSREYLKACLESITSTVQTVSYEVVVIDAGSFDGSSELLREHFPDIRFIQAQTNDGFARANNQAFEASSGDVLLFLNPDTVALDGAIDTMYSALTSLPRAGIVGCRLLNSDGSLQTSCVQSFPTIANQVLNSEFLRAQWPKSSLWGTAALVERETGVSEVEGISGACLMIRRSTFEQAGRFSSDYFMYVEDLDLSNKVCAAGYTNYYVGGAKVIHHGGQSSQKAANVFAAVMIPEAVRRFLHKTRGSAYSTAYRGMMFLSALARLGLLSVGWLAGARDPVGEASRRKWLAILRWSVNRDGIVAQYYRNDY